MRAARALRLYWRLPLRRSMEPSGCRRGSYGVAVGASRWPGVQPARRGRVSLAAREESARQGGGVGGGPAGGLPGELRHGGRDHLLPHRGRDEARRRGARVVRRLRDRRVRHALSPGLERARCGESRGGRGRSSDAHLRAPGARTVGAGGSRSPGADTPGVPLGPADRLRYGKLNGVVPSTKLTVPSCPVPFKKASSMVRVLALVPTVAPVDPLLTPTVLRTPKASPFASRMPDPESPGRLGGTVSNVVLHPPESGTGPSLIPTAGLSGSRPWRSVEFWYVYTGDPAAGPAPASPSGPPKTGTVGSTLSPGSTWISARSLYWQAVVEGSAMPAFCMASQEL